MKRPHLSTLAGTFVEKVGRSSGFYILFCLFTLEQEGPRRFYQSFAGAWFFPGGAMRYNKSVPARRKNGA